MKSRTILLVAALLGALASTALAFVTTRAPEDAPEAEASHVTGAAPPIGQTGAAQPPPAPQLPARLSAAELQQRLARGAPLLIIDVRDRRDYDSSSERIRGARRIPLAEIEQTAGQLPPHLEIVTYCACQGDGTSLRAAILLRRRGFNARVLEGGWQAWLRANGPVEPRR